MANKKSIIEIDVQDSKWKSFIAEFSKFGKDSKTSAETMGETAAAAAKIAAEVKKSADAGKQAVSAQEKQAKLAEAEAKATVKAAETGKQAFSLEQKKHDAQNKARIAAKKEREEAAKGWRDAVKWTGNIALNMASMAYGAAKWAAVAGVGSLFGLGGLASSASSVRRQSQGLGVDTGSLRAANVNFGRYVDPEAALGNIANAQSDLSKRWIFKGLGEDTQGKNAGDILPELLPKLVQAFRAGGSTTQGAQARGLDQLVGMEDLRRLSSLTEEELSKTIEAYKRDRAALNEGDATGRAWQDFLTSLHRAGQTIEVSLIKGLVTLTPYISSFADAIAKSISTFVADGGLQLFIERLGHGIGRLADLIGSEKFQDGMSAFATGIGFLGDSMMNIIGAKRGLNHLGEKLGSDASDAQYAVRQTWIDFKSIVGHVAGKLSGSNAPLAERYHNPGNLRKPGSTTEFQKFANDDDGIRALAHQIQLYEQRDKLTTIRGIISKYAPGNENNTAAYISNVSKATGFGADQKLDPSNIDQLVKLILAITKQENGRSHFTAHGVQVVVQNSTGGNAHTSVAALAGG